VDVTSSALLQANCQEDKFLHVCSACCLIFLTGNDCSISAKETLFLWKCGMKSLCLSSSLTTFSILDLADMFLALDKDMNGTLSKQELREYADGTLTDIFIERGSKTYIY